MSKIKVLSKPDEEHRTQEEWINFFNDKKQRMISMPDIFQLVKENNTETIESLRKDFDDYWIVTSTRIIYSKNNLSAKIIHNADSNVVKQKELKVKEVSDYTSKKLADVLDENTGLSYVRALIDQPKATQEQIIKFFTTLSGKKVDKIRFWTPSQSSRETKQIRSVGLGFGDFDRFGVVGVDWFDGSDGLSRGVVVPSAKQTKFFSNRAFFDTEEKTISIPMTIKLRKDIEKTLSKKKKVKIKWNLKVKLT